MFSTLGLPRFHFQMSSTHGKVSLVIQFLSFLKFLQVSFVLKSGYCTRGLYVLNLHLKAKTVYSSVFFFENSA